MCSSTSEGLVWRARTGKSPTGTASTGWATRGSCQTNNIWMDPPVKSTRGAFTHRPFNLDDIKIVINGADTASVPNQFAMRATDWNLTFVVACNTQVRINHLTEPSQRVRDAWGYPGLFATWCR